MIRTVLEDLRTPASRKRSATGSPSSPPSFSGCRLKRSYTPPVARTSPPTAPLLLQVATLLVDPEPHRPPWPERGASRSSRRSPSSPSSIARWIRRGPDPTPGIWSTTQRRGVFPASTVSAARIPDRRAPASNHSSCPAKPCSRTAHTNPFAALQGKFFARSSQFPPAHPSASRK